MKKGDLILFHDPTGSSPPEPGVILQSDDTTGDENGLGLAFVNFETGDYWVDVDDCELLNGDW